MRINRALLAAACGLCCPALWAQVATDANQRYQTAAGRKTIAASLGNPERDATERPQELVDNMGLRPGMTVADIGTGVGYMLPYLSRAVGPSGHVMAEDIFEDFLNAAKQRAAEQKLGNVSFLKGSETDARLADGSVDVILALVPIIITTIRRKCWRRLCRPCASAAGWWWWSITSVRAPCRAATR
jgi:predicted methyltransferase